MQVRMPKILQTEREIRPFTRTTPLLHSPYLSQLTGADVWLKLENWQTTGSFKIRGALSKIGRLSAAQRASCVQAINFLIEHGGLVLGHRRPRKRALQRKQNGPSHTGTSRYQDTDKASPPEVLCQTQCLFRVPSRGPCRVHRPDRYRSRTATASSGCGR